MAYVINSKKCDGCGVCIDECVMEAISKDPTGAVIIDPDRCTDCGTCIDVCPKDAVHGVASASAQRHTHNSR